MAAEIRVQTTLVALDVRFRRVGIFSGTPSDGLHCPRGIKTRTANFLAACYWRGLLPDAAVGADEYRIIVEASFIGAREVEMLY